MRHFIFMLLIFPLINLRGQHVSLPIQRTFPVVSCYTENQNDAFSFTTNQARLASIEIPEAAIYSESRFGLKDLKLVQMCLAIPHRSGGWGFDVLHAGNQFYSETSLAFAFGKKLGDALSLGVQFNYHLTSVTGHRKRGAVGVETGTIIKLAENLAVGFHIKNAFTTSRRFEEKLPVSYAFGLGYDLSALCFLTLLVERHESRPASFIAAVQYQFIPAFYMKAGVANQLTQFFFALGLQWREQKFEFTGGIHGQLGFTPAVTLIFSLRKGET